MEESNAAITLCRDKHSANGPAIDARSWRRQQRTAAIGIGALLLALIGATTWIIFSQTPGTSSIGSGPPRQYVEELTARRRGRINLNTVELTLTSSQTDRRNDIRRDGSPVARLADWIEPPVLEPNWIDVTKILKFYSNSNSGGWPYLPDGGNASLGIATSDELTTIFAETPAVNPVQPAESSPGLP
jgi:hypothetical protein